MKCCTSHVRNNATSALRMLDKPETLHAQGRREVNIRGGTAFMHKDHQTIPDNNMPVWVAFDVRALQVLCRSQAPRHSNTTEEAPAHASQTRKCRGVKLLISDCFDKRTVQFRKQGSVG